MQNKIKQKQNRVEKNGRLIWKGSKLIKTENI